MPRTNKDSKSDPLDASRESLKAEADRLFTGPLTLADAWACLQQFDAQLPHPLPHEELTGLAALAAFAAGRDV
jgi:hypothetical protein